MKQDMQRRDDEEEAVEGVKENILVTRKFLTSHISLLPLTSLNLLQITVTLCDIFVHFHFLILSDAF